MMRLLFWILLLIPISCHDKQGSTLDVSSKYYEHINVLAWQREILPIDSVRIEGVLPVLISRDSLVSFLGRPDKIVDADTFIGSNLDLVDGSGERSHYLIIDSNIFELKNKNAILHTFSFENNNKRITIPGMILSNQTSPKDVQMIFPESGRLLIGHASNTWSGFMMVNEGPPNTIHKMWVFIFKSGHLSKLKLVNYSPFI